MKTRLLLLTLILASTFQACKDDPGGFTQIKGIENLVYLEIKAYRESNGLSGNFAHQVLIVEEAQRYAHKMAIGLEEVGTQGMDEHWAELEQYWDFYNRTGLVLETTSADAVEIFRQILEQPGADSTMLGDLTQCGVGITAGENDFNYVAVFLAKAD